MTGLKIVLSSHVGQVDFAGEITFHFHLPNGQGNGQVV